MLDAKLEKELRGLRQLALTRTKNADGRIKEASEEQQEAALTKLQTELKSGKLKSFLKEYEIPASSLIRKSNEALKNSVVRRFKPDLKTKINKVTVSVYLIREMSPNDPYVIIQFTESDTAVLVILNVVHPHWAQLTKSESILNFIRHCTYDGVAEWKAHSETGKIEPDTVKLIKDNLLRIPMKIEDSQHAGN